MTGKTTNGSHRTYSRGLRPITAGLIAAETLAANADDTTPSSSTRIEWRAGITTLLRAGYLSRPAANLALLLVDLCGTWERESVPIVFATNARLADALGYRQDRSIRVLLGQLTRSPYPLICYVDRPGGRRGVDYDPVSGARRYYGISLAPLIAQLQTIAELKDRLDADYRTKKTLRSAITAISTRMGRVTEYSLSIGMPGMALLAALDQHMHVSSMAATEHDIASLQTIRDSLQRDLDQAEAALLRFSNDNATVNKETKTTEDSGYVESDVPPITINKKITDKSDPCSYQPPRATTQDRTNRLNRLDETVLERGDRSPKERRLVMKRLIVTDLEKYKIYPQTLTSLSEEIHAFLPFDKAEDPDWDAVTTACDRTRVHIGLSEGAWHHVVEELGPIGACAALCFVMASADIHNPAGYLRKLADLAMNGTILDLGSKLRSKRPQSNAKGPQAY